MDREKGAAAGCEAADLVDLAKPIAQLKVVTPLHHSNIEMLARVLLGRCPRMFSSIQSGL